MATNIPKVLFLANIPKTGEPRSIGGATVLAQRMLEYLKVNSAIEVHHKNIRTLWRHKLMLLEYILWLFKFPFVVKNVDVVSIHGTKDVHFTVGGFLILWCKLLGKTSIYHFFGGNFHLQYSKAPGFVQWFLKKTILNADTVFFETKQQITFFKKQQIDTVWLPNARHRPQHVSLKKPFTHSFVFVSRIVPSKGVNELVEAARTLPDPYKITLYGPIDDRHYSHTIFNNSPVQYKGELAPDQVVTTLASHDVLVLPSYFEGEGYPGIIIEALSLGMPVITTQWRSLPEIVTNNDNGLLIPIQNTQALVAAITSFNTSNYAAFQQRALASFDNFDTAIVFKKLISAYTKKHS